MTHSSVTGSIADARRVARFVWSHPANEGKRITALLRATRFQIRGRLLSRPSRAQLGTQSYIMAHLHRSGGSKAVYANPPDYAEMLAWKRALQPGDTFLDVGANVGTYAIWAADAGAHVIAMEPAEDTFDLLVENIKLNGYKIQAIKAAAGATCGIGRLTSGLDCVNRLDPQGEVEATVVTVDSVIADRAIAGMKIDVEGSELNVLRGCSRALAEHRIKLIQLEWNSTSQAAVGSDRRPVADLLAKMGYTLYRPDGQGVLIPTDDVEFGPDVFARPD